MAMQARVAAENVEGIDKAEITVEGHMMLMPLVKWSTNKH